MKHHLFAFCLFVCGHGLAYSDNAGRYFDDQEQYELFYEFEYQVNVVESFILECTGDRHVSYKFAFATAGISNSYKSEIMKLSELSPDPFTNKPLSKRLWDEITLAVTRDPSDKENLAEPVLMAQKDVLRLINTFRNDKDTLCDFVFWEEVQQLEETTGRLMQDVKVRKRGTRELASFEKETKQGMLVMNRLFKANPLRKGSLISLFLMPASIVD